MVGRNAEFSRVHTGLRILTQRWEFVELHIQNIVVQVLLVKGSSKIQSLYGKETGGEGRSDETSRC
jgi:hypothetical protein